MKKPQSILDRAFGMVVNIDGQHPQLEAVRLLENPRSLYGTIDSLVIKIEDQHGNQYKMNLDDICSPTATRGLVHPYNLLQDENGDTLVDENGRVFLDPSKQFAQKLMETLSPSSEERIPAALPHSALAETEALRQGLE